MVIRQVSERPRGDIKRQRRRRIPQQLGLGEVRAICSGGASARRRTREGGGRARGPRRRRPSPSSSSRSRHGGGSGCRGAARSSAARAARPRRGASTPSSAAPRPGALAVAAPLGELLEAAAALVDPRRRHVVARRVLRRLQRLARALQLAPLDRPVLGRALDGAVLGRGQLLGVPDQRGVQLGLDDFVVEELAKGPRGGMSEVFSGLDILAEVAAERGGRAHRRRRPVVCVAAGAACRAG